MNECDMIMIIGIIGQEKYMKKNFRKLFVLLLLVAFLFPVAKIFAYFDEGDTTINVRIEGGHGCYTIEAEGNEEASENTERALTNEHFSLLSALTQLSS